MCTSRTRCQVKRLESFLFNDPNWLLSGMKATLNELGSERCFSQALCMWMSNCKDPPHHSFCLSQKKGTWRAELSSENRPTSWSSTPPDPTRRSTAARWPPSTIKGTLMRYLLVLRWEVRSAELHQGRGRAGAKIYTHFTSGQSENLWPSSEIKNWRLHCRGLKQAVKAAHPQRSKFFFPSNSVNESVFFGQFSGET